MPAAPPGSATANVEENKKGCKKLSSEGTSFPLKCCAGALKGAEPLTYITNLQGYDFWIM